jgi:hypothetical protein
MGGGFDFRREREQPLGIFKGTAANLRQNDFPGKALTIEESDSQLALE